MNDGRVVVPVDRGGLGCRFLVEVWRNGAFEFQWNGCCYDEESAMKVGEDCICRLRAADELEAMGQDHAAKIARWGY